MRGSRSVPQMTGFNARAGSGRKIPLKRPRNLSNLAAAMPYRAPVDEYRFLHEHVIPVRSMIESGLFEGLDADDMDAALETAGAVAEREVAPVRLSGDRHPAKLENGAVRTPPGFAAAYDSVASGGWIGMSADPRYGGLGLPVSLRCAFNDAVNGACMAFGLNPMLTQCQIDALEQHGCDQLKDLYLPRLVSGEWSGTMNITEPQAGSDVGAIRAVAEPAGGLLHLLSGEKIFISWADSDFVSNVCHLVLARMPDAPPGPKGLSLFLAPKFIPGDSGGPGERNSIRIVSLEHKLGIHASPTAVVRFDKARAWMVGEPDGGLGAMFTMMNHARLCTGAQGVGVAEAAWQQARDYALDRRQGRPPPGRPDNIASHPNVRRSLARMRAQIFAARSVCAMCAFALDMARKTGGEEWRGRAAVLTPIAKAFGSDTGVEVSLSAVQIHGGSGYIEDTGAAQFLRDALAAAIYEGTNDIQALDLTVRKLKAGGAVFAVLQGVRDAVSHSRNRGLAGLLRDAESEVRSAAESLAGTASRSHRAAGAVPFLRAMALTIGGQCHLTAAAHGDERRALAEVYARRCLPEVRHLCEEAKLGDGCLFDIDF